jgi:hypothetical protein
VVGHTPSLTAWRVITILNQTRLNQTLALCDGAVDALIARGAYASGAAFTRMTAGAPLPNDAALSEKWAIWRAKLPSFTFTPLVNLMFIKSLLVE